MTMGKVLMIYTGGTIGMVHSDPTNPLSPLVPASWKDLATFIPTLPELPIEPVLHEMDLIDSAEMHPAYWIEIARVIRDYYSDYDGFVVLHGTDTMTYTATALSFLLEHLDKPVIVTGSQLPIALPRSDAAQNLVTSLMLAGARAMGMPVIPEVCICFNNTLIRGNRSRKISSSGYAGFASPNYPILADIGEHITVNVKVIRRPPDKNEHFYISELLEKNVMLLDVFPGINPDILHSVFAIESLKGVIFRTYGAGNAPTNPEFLTEIRYAVKERKLPIVNITQCNEGIVEMGLYDASAELLRIGVISGVDMTPEAALVKMMLLLGERYDDIEIVKDLMSKDLRGELSLNVFNFIYDGAAANPIYRAPAKQVPAGFVKERIVTANLRFDGVRLRHSDEADRIELAVFINYPSADLTTDTSIPQCLGVLERSYAGERVHLILECTAKVQNVVAPGRPVQLSVVSRSNCEVSWDGAFLSAYTSVEG